ncbi:hypothetical protein [Albibacterium bauzanense]|uniref:Uncharacterized protein n=1 Tax=Albibacterium bauzanense TaxID=653929 RepID=A0A4R1M2L6_9SPHI|nr:hypothetical protein [Albibacterium bauzanense]TCK85084.1 hypothetical protein C8N28_0381 [Albibacterium bauzanense]
MAIIKNGKIHGRIGNYVYRVVNGQEIIQSYPRTVKPRGGTVLESKKFGKAAYQSARIFGFLKDFALNNQDGSFYCSMVSFFKKSFYSKHKIADNPVFDDWETVPGFESMVVNSKAQVSDILLEKPQVSITGESCTLDISEFDANQEAKGIMKDVSHIGFGFLLIHYDFDSRFAEVVHYFESERFRISKGFKEQNFEIPLVIDNATIERGMLLFAFGLRLFASLQSFGYLNNKSFNPCAILGVWYKR